MLMDTVCLLEVIEATNEKICPPQQWGRYGGNERIPQEYADGVAACIAALVKQGYITILKEGAKMNNSDRER